MHHTHQRLPVISILSAILIWTSIAWATGQPKLLEGVEPFDCVGCHDSPVLPAEHPDVKQGNNADCTQCHQSGRENTIRGRIPLSHTHMAAGVSCSDCHGEQRPFKSVGTEQCRECHGDPEKLVALTRDLPVNPHTSPHYGNEMDCDLCHHLHSRSENTCNQCHEHPGRTP